MKNVRQTVSFAAFMLTQCPYSEEVRDLSSELFKIAKGTPEHEEKKVALLAKMTDENTAQLGVLGAELPHDPIEVSLSVGVFLFDVYRAAPKPANVNTPLGGMIYQKKLQDLAELFSKDEFEIPPHAVPMIREVLLDQNQWVKTVLSSWIDIKGEKPGRLEFTMAASGALYFNEILQLAVEAVYDPSLG